MLRYLLLFAALGATVHFLQSPLQAQPKPPAPGTPQRHATGKPEIAKPVAGKPAVAKPVPGKSAPPKPGTKKPGGPHVPSGPAPLVDDASVLPDEGKLAPGPAAGPMDANRKFQVIQNPTTEEPQPLVVRDVHKLQEEKVAPPYPEPPGLDPLFSGQQLPRDNEPSWMRTRRLHSMLLPPASRPVVRRSTKRVPLSGKCVAVRGVSQIVVLQGKSRTTVPLYAIGPVPGGNMRTAQKGLSSLVLGKTVTIYPVRKPGQSGAWVFAGKTCANREMVAQGWAQLLPGATSQEAKLVSLQQAAKSAKRGLWAKS
jgi:hypothetical protein